MEYRVLARKYRPTNFDDLIGQEALVQTLENAFSSGRVAHAFLLTGIRGVGKTTTARIIARALNCIGADGLGAATTKLCGQCVNCKMISEDRHPDVLEMDAASRTGVDSIRDLIETVRYAPSSARTKVYIIDEVHMLSTSAFNALLKTLEEPPPHVKFIFATTEVRKIPVTILSRCQRFDLKRVSTEKLAAHLGNITGKEGVTASPEALTLIATAAEGSVRDSLSLLDQAIARHGVDAPIEGSAVRDMLGLADRTQSFALLGELFEGDVNAALARFSGLYHQGSDPLTSLNDVLMSLHFVTRLSLSKEPLADPSFSETEKKLGGELAAKLSMPALTRMWQLLLKGVQEVKFAHMPYEAAEMVLVRAAYASELPTPEEALKKLAAAPKETPKAEDSGAKIQDLGFRIQESPKAAPPEAISIASFSDMVALFETKREALIASQLKQFASLVSFAPPVLEVNMGEHASREMAKKMSDLLTAWTGQTWRCLFVQSAGEPPLAAQEAATRSAKIEEAKTNPLVASLMAEFPGAEVVSVK
jgi:DNA polymerase III subunit gamma/tau